GQVFRGDRPEAVRELGVARARPTASAMRARPVTPRRSRQFPAAVVGSAMLPALRLPSRRAARLPMLVPAGPALPPLPPAPTSPAAAICATRNLRLPVPNLPHSVAVGDLNGDGRPDLVLADFNQVSVLLGDGTGTFAPRVEYAAGAAPATVALADLDGDGK